MEGRGWRGRIYHSEIPKSAQCERHERAAVGTRRDVVQVDLWVEMGAEEGGKPRRETVFVSQVSRAVHGHGDRPAD